MRRQIPWIRVLTEGVVIVISILLAFGIDAYWDERQEKSEERAVLLGLQADFLDLRARLGQWATINQAGVRLLGDFLSDSLADLDRAVADSALVLAVAVNVLDQGGPLEALFASGRLELVQNPEIRQRLGKWPDWLEDIHTNDLSRRESAIVNIIPLLTAHGWPDFDFFGCDSPPCVPSAEMPTSYLSMARIQELRAMLYIQQAFISGAADDHADRIPEVDHLLELIDEELATRW